MTLGEIYHELHELINIEKVPENTEVVTDDVKAIEFVEYDEENKVIYIITENEYKK